MEPFPGLGIATCSWDWFALHKGVKEHRACKESVASRVGIPPVHGTVYRPRVVPRLSRHSNVCTVVLIRANYWNLCCVKFNAVHTPHQIPLKSVSILFLYLSLNFPDCLDAFRFSVYSFSSSLTRNYFGFEPTALERTVRVCSSCLYCTPAC
jgi:hypothetical protein